ncbi:MAG TPA: GNAT family protein [Ideonella sp.]|nr:GNAT family protein [Ideonella sp.]
MDAEHLWRAPRELTTPRLVLESPRPQHAGAVMAAINASLPDLRFVDWGRRAVDRVWADAFAERGMHLVEDGEALIYYAFERTGQARGAFVGHLDLHGFDLEAPRCEIGYVADSRQAGRGLMREAAAALVELAFRLGFMRIEALTDTRNARALRFAAALGFEREGVLRAHRRDLDGALCDEVLFARLHPSLG